MSLNLFLAFCIRAVVTQWHLPLQAFSKAKPVHAKVWLQFAGGSRDILTKETFVPPQATRAGGYHVFTVSHCLKVPHWYWGFAGGLQRVCNPCPGWADCTMSAHKKHGLSWAHETYFPSFAHSFWHTHNTHSYYNDDSSTTLVTAWPVRWCALDLLSSKPQHTSHINTTHNDRKTSAN